MLEMVVDDSGFSEYVAFHSYKKEMMTNFKIVMVVGW